MLGNAAGVPSRAPRPLRARDEGSVSLELAIAFPVVLLLVTALMQFGLWYFARTVALAAAQEGVTAARALDAAPGAGVVKAQAYAAESGAGTLLDAAATVTVPRPGSIAVEVRGRSLSLLPGFSGLPVSQSAEGPGETFTDPGTP